MDLDAAKQTFVQESQELLDQMEQNLLIMENDPSDDEALGALFRAAHTLKGTAGMFQFEQIVRFVHVVENVLDRARDNEVKINGDLIAILLSCHDHAEKLVSNAIEDQGDLDEQTREQGELLLGQLAAFSASENSDEILNNQQRKETTVTEQPNPQRNEAKSFVQENLNKVMSHKDWHISLRFGSNVYRNGLDPYSFLRYLFKLGEVKDLRVVTDNLPSLDNYEPESNYLGFEIRLSAQTSIEEIEKVFEFILDDCELRIREPHSTLAEFVDLINQLPEKKDRMLSLFREMELVSRDDLEILANLSNGQDKPAVVENAMSVNLAPNAKEVREAPTETSLRANEEIDSKGEKASVAEPGMMVHESPREQGKDTSKEKKSIESRFIRVDAEKLDQMINLVGELVIASATVNEQAGNLGDGKLVESTSLMGRLVSEIRDTTLNIRMVQIGETFNRYRRVVRDLSHEMKKEIELTISGGETELDKTIIEKLTDPLTHLIRNAIDHGIESPQQRTLKGKSPSGNIFLNAYHETGSIVIEVKDDGGGINKDNLLEKGIEKGIVQAGQQLSDKEIYNLIFHAGFSTAKEITDVSGRGVGMDVVKRNIESLRGIVDIHSVENEGTTVRIRLPLTLAIIDGFFVMVGNTTWVVPLDMVLECIEFNQNEKTNGERSAATKDQDQKNDVIIRGEEASENSQNKKNGISVVQKNNSGVNIEGEKEDFINLRGEVLPFLRLGDLFGEGIDISTKRQKNIVVVQYAGQKAGLLVDSLLGEFQTVIKPLGPVFQHLRGISGATIMGSGEVALIIDVPRLVQYAKELEERHFEA